MRTVALAAAALLALAGCTIDTPEPQAPEPTTSTPTSTTAAPLEESDKVDPPVSETPLEPAPYVEPAPVEPTISYCGDSSLHQTGTTFYTDGTSGWTQYCANEMLASPPPAVDYGPPPLVDNAPPFVPAEPYYETSGDAQKAHGCAQGYIPANQC